MIFTVLLELDKQNYYFFFLYKPNQVTRLFQSHTQIPPNHELFPQNNGILGETASDPPLLHTA